MIVIASSIYSSSLALRMNFSSLIIRASTVLKSLFRILWGTEFGIASAQAPFLLIQLNLVVSFRSYDFRTMI